MRFSFFYVRLIFLFMGVHVATAQDVQTLVASDVVARDQFGASMDMYGDVAVIGAMGAGRTGDCDGIGWTGSAYVFRKVNGVWIEEQELTPGECQRDDYFGAQVAVYEDVIVVTALLNRDEGPMTGAAYVYRYVAGTWIEEHKLVASDRKERMQFGTGLSVYKDVIVIGAYQEDIFGPYSGSVYLFRNVAGTWIEEAKLIPSDGMENAFYGLSTAISNETVFVGAVGDDSRGERTGSVYVYRKSGDDWIETQKLEASDAAAYQHFGGQLAIYGDVAVISAVEYFFTGYGPGAAYVFRRTGEIWTEEKKLTASDADMGDRFGYAVDIYGNLAVIGAINDDDSGIDSGAVYIFRNFGTDWIEGEKISAPSFSGDARFGWSVAISDHDLLVSAPLENSVGERSGVAYSIQLSEKANARQNLPSDLDVEAVFPNPVRSTASIVFTAPSPRHVRISLFDLLGREVKEVFTGVVSQGGNTIEFNSQGLSSGIYVINVETTEGSSSKSVLVVK